MFEKTILYGVLNWGLGHATRSSVIIKALTQMGYKVVLASDGEACEWLKRQFPELEIYELPPYRIRYRSKNALVNAMLYLPYLLSAIRKEKKWVKEVLLSRKVHGVISDNRLNFYRKDVPCIYISHQLTIPLKHFSSMASYIHAKYINKFTEVWVPDDPEYNLSGQMSQNRFVKPPVKKIGWLSRFGALTEPYEKGELLAVISGPEPTKSNWAKQLFKAAEKQKIPITLAGVDLPYGEYAQSLPMPSTEVLKAAIEVADLVISRSGYSSLMDYAALGVNALVVPTPGQPEQEYLCYRLKQENWLFSVEQENLDLEKHVKEARKYKGLPGIRRKYSWEELFCLFEGE